MILADTNALLALLVADRPVEAALVLGVAEEALAAGGKLVVSEAVLVELCAVLQRDYGFRRPDIAGAVAELIRAPPMAPVDAGVVFDALDLMQRKPTLALTDCLLMVRSSRTGARVLSFGQKLRAELVDS